MDTGRLIRECLSITDKTALQNTLMRMPDKVCAVGLASVTPEERDPVYSLIAPRKASRVREEIRLEAMRRTTPLMKGRIMREFLSYFGSAGITPGTRGPIWIKPRKRSRTQE
jgi:hypothetical protein